MRRYAIPVALTLLAITGSACSQAPQAEARMPTQASVLSPNVFSANTEFGFSLQAELFKQDPGGNITMSPLSISVALAMTCNGDAGDTAAAMAKTLGF